MLAVPGSVRSSVVGSVHPGFVFEILKGKLMGKVMDVVGLLVFHGHSRLFSIHILNTGYHEKLKIFIDSMNVKFPFVMFLF